MRRRRDAGMTLIELLLSTSILGIILTTITGALIVFFKNAEYTLDRDDHSGGAAVAASYLDRDLASATSYSTTPSSTTICGAGTRNSVTATWGEHKAYVDSPEPTPNAGGSFSVTYKLVDDVKVNGEQRCRLDRVYSATGSVDDTVVLVRNLRPGEFGATTGTASCGGSSTELLVTLQTYLDDIDDDYRFSGCLMGRLG